MCARQILLLLVSGCGVFSAAAAEPGAMLARFVSGELRAHDARLEALRAELAKLPPDPKDHTTERIGWHSDYEFGRGAPLHVKGVQLDLGASEPFDAVVLVPVNVANAAYPGPGYGFPVRFRVEVSDDPSFATPITLANHTGADFPNPGNLPVLIEAPGARGRYIRLTATQLFARPGDAFCALGELMVLRGKRNLAVTATVAATDSYDNVPTWAAANLQDSQSVLGPPALPAEHRRNGYHSAIAKDPDERKWVQLDLGRSHAIEELRLFAARPSDFPDRRGFGFPPRFRVEVADSPDFASPTVLMEWDDRDCINPGDNPFVVPAYGTMGRYVRVTATRLWPRDKDYVFALSEIQVFAGNENIARTAQATALDSIQQGLWSLRQINDGFASLGELRDWPEWLRGLSRRREVLLEISRLEIGRNSLVNAALWRFGAVATVALMLATAAWSLRQRRARRREVARLRQRIAADLHDEIGSNLGSIALLARLAGEHQNNGAHADLVEIQQIAQQTADSMRDIVWLIQPGQRAPTDLIARMREVAAKLLADVEWRFEAGGVEGPFSLEFERQIFLLYKEALHNIRKHARAKRVVIQAAQQGREFVLTIADDGTGFEPASVSTGHGLASMQHRAGLLRGTLTVRAKPSEGTLVELRTRLE